MSLRWPAWLCIAFSLAIAGASGLGTLTPADAHCLRFDSGLFSQGGVIDLSAGTSIGLPPSEAEQARANQLGSQLWKQLYTGVFSPDDARFAYSIYDTSTQQLELFLVAHGNVRESPAITVSTTVGDPSPLSFDRNTFAWSPDSQWLAYWHRASDGSVILVLADRSGSTVRFQRVAASVPGNTVIFHGWSADSRYLALSVADQTDPNRYALSFWSMPDLTLIRTITYYKTFAVQTPLQQTPNSTAFWSAQGHNLLYLSDDPGAGLQLWLAAPDSDPIVIDLPTSSTTTNVDSPPLPLLTWSPDSRFVAVSQGKDSGSLDVVDLTTHQVHDLGKGANAAANSSDPLPPYSFWSEDGRTLYYLQLVGQDGLADLMAYQPSRNNTDQIASAIAIGSGQFFNGMGLFRQEIVGLERFLLLDMATAQVTPIVPPAASDLLQDRHFLGRSHSGNRLVFADHLQTQGATASPYTRIWTSDTAGNTYVLPAGSYQTYISAESWSAEPVSPDGKWVVFGPQFLNQNGPGATLIALDTGEQRQLTSDNSTLVFGDPVSWRSDSRQLLISGLQFDPATKHMTQVFILLDIPSGSVRRVIDLHSASAFAFGYFAQCQ